MQRGAALPDRPAAVLHRADARDLTGRMLDAHPDLSLRAEASRRFPGQRGLVVPSLLPRFRFANEDTGEDGLSLRCGEANNGLFRAFRFACVHDIPTACAPSIGSPPSCVPARNTWTT